jgi:ABC-type Zn uptake system ZnuABC Zn-binding protein ZnuA
VIAGHGAGTLPVTPPTVESITKPGAEIHNYQPTPRDILKAHDAN